MPRLTRKQQQIRYTEACKRSCRRCCMALALVKGWQGQALSKSLLFKMERTYRAFAS